MRSTSRSSFRLACIAVLCLLAAMVAMPKASAQVDFTMTVNPNLSPSAVAPGGQSAASITIVTGTGFVGPITLGCTVTPSVSGTVSNPVCQVSPPTVSSSGAAGATITTTTQTTTVSYGITITATDSTGTVTSPTLTLTVLSVTPQFTIAVQTAIAPSSVPAGSGAQGTITVNPVNGYQTPGLGSGTADQKGITLYCASITPLVTIPPYCSFSYPQGAHTLQISGNTPVTSTITITSFGPVVTGSAAHRQPFYALWIPLPIFGLVGVGAAVGGKRARKACGLLALFVIGAAFLLLPACGNTTNTVTTPNGTTPSNTYTFTLVGVDGDGVASSNTGSGSGTTVSLTVTAPPAP